MYVVWIPCLSTRVDGLEGDTIANIEAGMRFIATLKHWLITKILLVGDIHLWGKQKRVAEMMEEYIYQTFPQLHSYYHRKLLVEADSLTSRENIPMGLDMLEHEGIFPADCEHVICTEKWHGQIMQFILRYHLRKMVHDYRKVPSVTIMPSSQRLPRLSQLKRMIQQVDVRLDPNGSTPWYKWKYNQRAQYLHKQT